MFLVLFSTMLAISAPSVPISECKEIQNYLAKGKSVQFANTDSRKEAIKQAVKKRDLAVLGLEDFKIRAYKALDPIAADKKFKESLRTDTIRTLRATGTQTEETKQLIKELKKNDYVRAFEVAQSRLDQLASQSVVNGFSCSIAGLFATYSSDSNITDRQQMRPSSTYVFQPLRASKISSLEAIGDAETSYCIGQIASECEWVHEVPTLGNLLGFSAEQKAMVKLVVDTKSKNRSNPSNLPASGQANPSQKMDQGEMSSKKSTPTD